MIKDRIKEVRKKEKLSQPIFGERLGVTRDVVSNIELGRVEPKEVFIKLLCSEFKVNEHWLRTGEGEMYVEQSDDEKLVELLTDVLTSEDPRVKRLATVLAKLDDKDLTALDAMVDALLAKEKKVTK